MSKSLGNIVDPAALADKYGAEALRYYLMSDILTGRDTDFSKERLLARYNADLANSLGNLLNRTLTMANRYRGGVVRQSSTNRANIRLLRDVSELHQAKYLAVMDDFLISTGLAEVSLLAAQANVCIDAEKPWVIAKDASQVALLDSLFYSLAESLRTIAILISPVLPKAAHGIFDQLNWKMELNGKEGRFSFADAEWGKLPDGHVVGKPTPLFPRIETT
jgi:methionyl-tRNA synthetase